MPIRLTALLLATACASAPGGQTPGPGVPALVRIERTGSDETDPPTLHVPPGTEVTWQNRTTRTTWVRFTEAVPEICGHPVHFARSSDGRSFVSEYLGPFEEARLCILSPGRYDFVVSIPGASGDDGFGRSALPPAKYGTVVIER